MRKIALYISLIFLLACEGDKVKPTINYDMTGDRIPVQESWNSQILFSKEGVKQAILYTDHLFAFDEDEEKVKYLENVKIDFFNEHGEISSVLTSEQGRVNDITQDMYAIKNVVAKNDSGVVLETEELIWKSRINKITTDKFVTITSKDEKIEGYGFESDQTLKNYTIYNITYYTQLKK